LTFAQISWYVLGYNVIKLAGMWPAGRLVDRVGARPVLQAMVVIYMVFFFAFPWFNRDHLWLIVTVWSLVGVADSLCLVAGTSCLYHALPGGRERAGYLAVAQGAVMVMMGAGPLLVRPYLGWADGLEFWVAGVRLEKFRLLFVVSGLLTTLSLIPVRRLADTHDVRWGTVVGAVRRWRPFGLVPRFWRVPRG